MKKRIFLFGLCLLFFWGACRNSLEFQNFMEISRQDSLAAVIQKAVHVVPTSRQIEWQELEYIGFLRFSINTLNGREWGTGPEMKVLIFSIRPDWTPVNGSDSSNRKR